jgi:DNA repair exonuclease SbcCD ATPase subunit
MDVTPRVDRLLAKAADEQASEQRMIREALRDFHGRLTRMESITGALADKIEPWSDPSAATADLAVRLEKRIGKRFEDLAMTLDDMAVTIENRAVEVMAEDMAAVADELRKAVSELARLLVRDRNRISRALTEHRNAILAELRLPPSNGRTVDLSDSYDDEYDDDEDEPDVVVNGGGRRLLRRLR